VRDVEKRLRALIEPLGEAANVSQCLDQAVLETLAASDLAGDDKARLEQEFGWFMAGIGDFQFAVTRPYYTNREKKAKGSGGLFSVTINPYTCKGCMECVEVCGDDALVPTAQTAAAVDSLRRGWDFWLDLPTTRPEFIRIDDLDERIGALETLLLDKKNFGAMACGDGSCLGCGEKSSIRLFTAVVSALMQPRVRRFVERIDDLITRLDQHIRLRLADSMDLSDAAAIDQIVAAHRTSDLTLAELSGSLGKAGATEPVDTEWLQQTTRMLRDLRHLKWLYTDGRLHRGRADMGIINSTGCSSVWGSTYPYNPYPFPWANHLFQDSPSVSMGVFQGHMAKMAEGFKTVRMAELELADGYRPAEHEEFFTYFGWRKFSDEEWLLCPPVVAVGGDGAMYDIGFQNLSRMLMSGFPIKALVLDTQVYSNTGGQACTSGFTGQVSDMAAFGKAHKGKEEVRKEMALIGAAHRTAYVMQGSIANITHLLEGFIAGLNSRRPALFNVYAACQPEHGIGDDASAAQSRLAVESRAYPLFRYDPDAGTTYEACCDLDGNPAIDDDWPSYRLSYLDDQGREARLEVPMTFADFAVTEGRFRKHFRKAPPDTWNDSMLPLHELLEKDAAERDGLFPYIWGVDAKNNLMRIMVSAEIVRSCEDRRNYWHQLKSLAGVERRLDLEQVIRQARTDMAQKLSASLLSLAGSGDVAKLPGDAGDAAQAAAPQDYEPVWIDTPACTACDECTKINPKIFAYNDDRHAIVINPRGGPYRDIVRAAEKCTAGVIHPGTPFDPNEKDLTRLIKRAEKYQ
jgi:pyruvate-ferredoxin/flavodoxin oxidoreductase